MGVQSPSKIKPPADCRGAQKKNVMQSMTRTSQQVRQGVLEYSDCIYDGTDGPRGYYSGSRGGSSGSGGKVWLFYIIALIIGYGINELLGAILLIGMIFWLIVCK